MDDEILTLPKKRTNERESFAVKLCPVCNLAYENTYRQYKKTKTTHYYEGFPKTGLYHQVCFKCKQKEKK